MNTLLDALCTDHANFGKLLNVIEHQVRAAAKGADPDIALLTAAADYLADYPAVYHHPLEDEIYQRLRDTAPQSTAAIDGILDEHIRLRDRLGQFRAALDGFGVNSQAARVALCRVADEFIEAQWAHMESERSELFPKAGDALSADDWSAIQREVPFLQDPLQGERPTGALQRLHQALVNSDSTEETATALTPSQAFVNAE